MQPLDSPTPISITAAIPGGSIDVVDVSDASALRLRLRADPGPDRLSIGYFYFRASGVRGRACTFRLVNVGTEAAARLEGREGFEDGLEIVECVRFRTDHEAIATLDSPHAAAGAGIDVVDAFFAECGGAADIVFVIRIAAIDQDVTGFEKVRQFVDHGFGGLARRDH